MRRYLLAALALAVAATPAGGDTLIVGNKGEDTVSFVDLATGREVKRMPTGRQPHEIAISPDGRHAAVVAYGGNTIDVFDVAAMRRTERIDLGTNTRPHGLLWLSENRLLTVAEGSGTIVLMTAVPQRMTRAMFVRPTAQEGSHMIAAGSGGVAYVTNMKSGTVSRLSMFTGSPTNVPAGAEPEGLALSPDGKRLWVADRKNDLLRIFDTATLREVARLPTGRVPIRVAIAADGKRAYVSNYGAGTLSVFDARALKPAGTVTVSGDPAAMQVTILLSRDGKRLYAAETGRDTVAEVDLPRGRVLRRLPAGKQGDGLAISPLTVTR